MVFSAPSRRVMAPSAVPSAPFSVLLAPSVVPSALSSKSLVCLHGTARAGQSPNETHSGLNRTSLRSIPVYTSGDNGLAMLSPTFSDPRPVFTISSSSPRPEIDRNDPFFRRIRWAYAHANLRYGGSAKGQSEGFFFLKT